VLRGEHTLNGFRNKDLAKHPFPRPAPSAEVHRRTALTSRA
jgi:hypothetical protein